jgi:hypothetical protein
VAHDPVEELGALLAAQRPVRRDPAHHGRIGVHRGDRVEILRRPPRPEDQALGLDGRVDHAA